MAVIERDVVLQSQDENGNKTIDIPMGRLGWIETDAEVKDAPTSEDYIPIVDMANAGQMKKARISALREASGAAPASHTHDDRYYTVAEVNTMLGGKSNTGHKHTKGEITDFPTTMTPEAHKHTKSEITDFPKSMPASDVYPWAKAAEKPKYTAADVGAATKSDVDTAINAAIGIGPVYEKVLITKIITDTTATMFTFSDLAIDGTVAHVLVFGGGGGGASGETNSLGGGGGGGYLTEGSYPVSPSTDVPIVVGVGGKSGRPAGSSGGFSRFGNLTANGGGGGNGIIGGTGGTGGGAITANGGNAQYGGGGGGGKQGSGGAGGTYGGGGGAGGGSTSTYGGAGGTYGGAGGKSGQNGTDGTNTIGMNVPFPGKGAGGTKSAAGSGTLASGGGGGYGGNGGNGAFL